MSAPHVVDPCIPEKVVGSGLRAVFGAGGVGRGDGDWAVELVRDVFCETEAGDSRDVHAAIATNSRAASAVFLMQVQTASL